MPLHLFLLFVFFQAPSVGEPVRSGCSLDDEQLATAGPGDRIEVHLALAGEDKICYKITLSRQERSLTGYVLGEALPAVADFVQLRERASEESAKAEARLALAPPVKAKDPAKPGVPEAPSYFADFSGRDPSGKTVSLSGLKGRAVVVSFWSPKSALSVGQLSSIQVLYQQLRGRGMNAVGISTDPNPYHVSEALDDTILDWPQIPDRGGLAARYRVDPRAGKTFVLDASHRIVAAGPMGPDIEKAIRELLVTPENQ
jgi:peroxiredoxin